MKREAALLLFIVVLLCGAWNTFTGGWHHRRLESLERIVGTETPASMAWTNGHTYSTIVKHSANCPCAKK